MAKVEKSDQTDGSGQRPILDSLNDTAFIALHT